MVNTVPKEEVYAYIDYHRKDQERIKKILIENYARAYQQTPDREQQPYIREQQRRNQDIEIVNTNDSTKRSRPICETVSILIIYILHLTTILTYIIISDEEGYFDEGDRSCSTPIIVDILLYFFQILLAIGVHGDILREMISYDEMVYDGDNETKWAAMSGCIAAGYLFRAVVALVISWDQCGQGLKGSIFAISFGLDIILLIFVCCRFIELDPE